MKIYWKSFLTSVRCRTQEEGLFYLSAEHRQDDSYSFNLHRVEKSRSIILH